MLKNLIKYGFAQFKTKVDHIQHHNYGPLQEVDYKLLNVN